MSSYKNPPEFDSAKQPFDHTREDLTAWGIVMDLIKKKCSHSTPIIGKIY